MSAEESKPEKPHLEKRTTPVPGIPDTIVQEYSDALNLSRIGATPDIRKRRLEQLIKLREQYPDIHGVYEERIKELRESVKKARDMG